MDINSQFLDYDFSKDPRFVFGFQEEPKLFASSLSLYEDAVPVLSESQLRESAEREEAEQSGADQLVSRIYDQGQEGSCVANACSQGNEMCQAEQFGIENVTRIAAMGLYQLIGRSAGSGAMISDGMKYGKSFGFAPLDNPENRARFGDKVMQNTGFRQRRPAGIETVAAELAYEECYAVQSVEGILTALANHDPVIVGRQGHSICYVRHIWINGAWRVKYANSWHESWGEKGFGYDSIRQIQMSAGWAFVIRKVRVPYWLLPKVA
jgi:hypothetical protein